MPGTINMDVSPNIQPPFEQVMPAGAQTAWEIVTATIVVFTILYFVRQARAEKSLFPIQFWLGTFLLCLFEPIIDIGMGCFYPHIGQHTVFEMYGRQMPLFLCLAYLGGIAPVMYAVAMRIERGVDAAYMWKAFVLLAIGTGSYEVITIYLGLWSYPSPAHPVRILNYPIGITIENGAAFLLTALAVGKLRPMITGGAKQWLAALILPIVFVMAEFGVGWPYFSVINTAAAVENRWLGFAGLFGTALFGLVMVWWVIQVGTVRSVRAPASAVARGVAIN